MTSDSNNRLWNKLLRPSYRDSFIATSVGVHIASQLHALRSSRGKSQEKLAEEIGMNQSTISQMEKPEYRAYSLSSLIRFAQYYKVGLEVRFVALTDQVKRMVSQTPESLAPAAFGEDVFGAPVATTDDPIKLLLGDTRGQTFTGRDQRELKLEIQGPY